MPEAMSIRDEAILRVTRVIQDAHGAVADWEKSTKQATIAIDVIRDLLTDDTCPRCHGTKTIGSEGSKCFVCAGNGFVRKSDMVTVTSHNGMKEGS